VPLVKVAHRNIILARGFRNTEANSFRVAFAVFISALIIKVYGQGARGGSIKRIRSLEGNERAGEMHWVAAAGAGVLKFVVLWRLDGVNTTSPVRFSTPAAAICNPKLFHNGKHSAHILKAGKIYGSAGFLRY
jgi:hypothetical protein